MKHLKKFNESSESHEISDCFIGSTQVISDTSIEYIIDGEEYSFTLRETSGETSDDYNYEFLPDSDLPFELTKEMTDKMWSLYESQATTRS